MSTETQALVRVEQDAREKSAEAVAVLELFRRVELKDPGEYEAVVGWVQEIKAKAKLVEEELKKALAPLEQTKEIVKSWWAPARNAYSEAEAHGKKLLLDYRATQQAKQIEALSQVQAAVANGDGEKTRALVAQATAATPPKVSGASFQSVYKFEVTDPNLVPREYLVPDEKAIGAMVRAKKGVVSIPGVRVWPEEVAKVGGVR